MEPSLLLLKYKYAILFPLAVFEGPLLALLVGFLVSTDVLSAIPAYVILVLGDLVPDAVCYLIGFYGDKRNTAKRYFGKSGKMSMHLSIIKGLWENHTKKAVLISKLAYGLSTPLLISAGLARIHFGKYLKYVLTISVIEYALLMTIGFYLGYTYKIAEGYVKYTGIGVAIIFIIGYVLLAKYFKKEFTRIEEQGQTDVKT